MSRFRFRLAAGLAALLGAYACGGDGIVLPDESQPADLIAMDGDGQAAPAGATLADAVVVLVTDARGRPVADQQVSFTITVGGGQVAPATARTDADGLVSATWTLGPSAGAQRLRAQATGTGVPADLTVDFTATALAGTGSTLVLVSGDGQTGSVGSALADPLVVRVVDPLGNPVSGQTVDWSVTGGGSIDPASSVTGANGETSAQRVLGPTAGEQTALATAAGLAGSPVTFTHTASASTPTSLVRVSGDAQTAPAGFQLPDSLVVQLRDANGNGVGGRTITWVVAAGGGVVDPVNSQTDQQGFAVTRWTLGPTAGSYTLNAVFSGLPSVPFAATATADVPTTLALLSGNSQTAPVGTALPLPLRVKVTDGNGNPVDNVSVTWAAVGGGSVSSTTTGTDGQGIAEVTRTLGPTPGTYTTTATVAGLAGSPVTFSSTAQVGPPARLAFLSQPAGALVGQTLASFQVEIQDAQGNRVTNATNQVTITSSVAGTLVGDNTENGVAGVATFDALALDEARTGYRFTARSSGLSDALSNAFDIAPGATTTDITGRSPTSSVTGQSVTVNYDVDVTAPAAGNLTGNVTVSDGLGASCTGGTSNAGTGSCAIVFPTAGARTLTATYADDPNFSGSTSPGFAVTVGKANVVVTITDEDPDTSLTGEAFTVTFEVSGSSGGVAPTGDVTISSGTQFCTVPVATGACPLTLTTLGVNTLTATYTGDFNYNGGSDTEPHLVQAATSTSLSSALNPSDEGENVTFTATVTSAGGTPNSGTVQFVVDGVDVSGPTGTDDLDATGQATFTTSSLTAGSHQIGARFLGSTNFAPSTASELTQVVNQANTAPTATDDDYVVDEDGSITVNALQGVLSNDTDAQLLTASVVTGPAHAASFTLNADGSFNYVPEADFSGSDGFVYEASDGSLSDQATVTITVNPVNDPPSFTAGADQVVSSLIASVLGVTELGWAQNISPGPNETGQTVSFQVTTDNDAAFTTLPAVAANGTLTFTPALRGDTAIVMVTVLAEDSEGATSAAQQFTITINP